MIIIGFNSIVVRLRLRPFNFAQKVSIKFQFYSSAIKTGDAESIQDSEGSFNSIVVRLRPQRLREPSLT